MKKLILSLSAFILLLAFPFITSSAEEATEHTHDYVYTNTAGDRYMHSVSCRTCEELFSPKPHKGGTSTCTKGEICVDCGSEYGIPDGHSGGASCIEEWICDVCDEYISGKNPNIHTFGYDVPNAEDATCEKDGYSGDVVCSGCGAMIEEGKTVPATGHSIKNGKCVKCGFVEVTTTKKAPATTRKTTVKVTKPTTTKPKYSYTTTAKVSQTTTTTVKATEEETTTLTQPVTTTEEVTETTAEETTETESSSTESESSGIKPVVIIASASLLIAAAALCIIIKKRKQ